MNYKAEIITGRDVQVIKEQVKEFLQRIADKPIVEYCEKLGTNDKTVQLSSTVENKYSVLIVYEA
ncbi:hypothetical protein [Aneurinibacillus tyrosinisolvens]|uniref:hypothetical protein n=1 Tax=Aneurinibacillus tyrosinisolvens TaxID=1443435 RepID=UPI00063FAD89|nr:hypothetical protein [Aneurinibacillus tyrosinisolvens]